MKRLGYTRFVAQGGDWGAAVTQAMGEQAAPEWEQPQLFAEEMRAAFRSLR
jgi:hypothetical protein